MKQMRMRKFIQYINSIIALFLVLSLLFASTEFGNGEKLGYFHSGSNAVIDTGVFPAPFLPAGETGIEKLLTSIHQQGLPAKRSVRSFFSLLTGGVTILGLIFSSFMMIRRRMRSVSTDQFYKSMIRYIHNKEDQK